VNHLDTEIKLLNASQLAKVLGVTPNYITRMKHAGFPMPDGRSTVREALEWRKANPEYHLPAKAQPQGDEDHLGVTSDK